MARTRTPHIRLDDTVADYERKLAALRAALDEGAASEIAQDFDIDALAEEIKRELANS